MKIEFKYRMAGYDRGVTWDQHDTFEDALAWAMSTVALVEGNGGRCEFRIVNDAGDTVKQYATICEDAA
jgi:hypothetical protein